MTLDEFVKKISEEFDETPVDQFTPSTNFKGLEEWSSLTALSIVGMVDDEYDKRITGADLRNVTTIEELYKLVEAK